MRFPKEVVADIHDSAPGTITVRWPIGAAEPQKGRTYWLLSEEDVKQAKEKADDRREHSPPTHRETMARMYKRRYGKWPEGFKLKPIKGPRKRPDACFQVLKVEVLDKGWDVIVSLYSDPDPIRHLHITARVPAQEDPLGPEIGARKVETEQEQIITPDSRSAREDKEDAFKLEHEASVDSAEIRKWEKKIADQRGRGKSAHFAEAALERARRRAALDAAETAA